MKLAKWIMQVSKKKLSYFHFNVRNLGKNKHKLRGLQTTARGPNTVREAISSGPRSYFNWSQRDFANN